jgi:hypothetical protein
MGDAPRKVERPWWVKIGLWGLPSRASAWAFFWLSMAIAIVCVAYGLIDRRAAIGGILVLAAAWYYLAIRWVDHHGEWV